MNIEFRAVEFMRQIRKKLTEMYHSDEHMYREKLKLALKDFKLRQKRSIN